VASDNTLLDLVVDGTNACQTGPRTFGTTDAAAIIVSGQSLKVFFERLSVGLVEVIEAGLAGSVEVSSEDKQDGGLKMLLLVSFGWLLPVNPELLDVVEVVITDDAGLSWTG